MMRWLTNLFSHDSANPDLIGQVKVTVDEIDAEARQRHERKLSASKEYLRLREIPVRPLYNAKGTQ